MTAAPRPPTATAIPAQTASAAAAEALDAAVASSDGGPPLTIGSGYHAGSGGLPAPARPGRVSIGTIFVSGALSRDVARRIVRQSLARFEACYAEGLRINPLLRGRVTTKLVLAPDGTVRRTQDGGSDLPDPNVAVCIYRAFSRVTFPRSDGVEVVVSVPLSLSPR
jgi:hypothetical protein